MPENDFDAQIDQIVKRAQKERKQDRAEEKTKKVEEIGEGKEKKREEKRKAREEPKATPKEVKKERKASYTAVIIVKVDYQGGNAPAKEQLAEELGRTIINWADQKKFYAISQKEPVPELISVDIDVQ